MRHLTACSLIGHALPPNVDELPPWLRTCPVCGLNERRRP